MGCRRSSEPPDRGVLRCWSRAELDARWGSVVKALGLLLTQLVGDTHRQDPVQTALIVIFDERVADESAQTVDDVSRIEVPRIESISWRIPSKSMTNISGLYG